MIFIRYDIGIENVVYAIKGQCYFFPCRTNKVYNTNFNFKRY